MATAADGPGPEAENVFRREGDFWTIAYEGRSIRLKDAKGIQYVAALLDRPGQEIHAADLVNTHVNGASHAGESAHTELRIGAGLGDAGEVLDAKARADYRARLESLRGELAEAESMNDSDRSEPIRQEIDFITQELSSGYGLGGRARKSASASERARKAVSSRVSESLSRIRKENPELGSHLENSIRLGTFCRYEPETPVRWSL